MLRTVGNIIKDPANDLGWCLPVQSIHMRGCVRLHGAVDLDSIEIHCQLEGNVRAGETVKAAVKIIVLGK